MAGSTTLGTNRNTNVRLCRLRIWPNYDGLGFNLEAVNKGPQIIRLVESNSPAAAGGLKILDVILAVNQQDVVNADYATVRDAIKRARDSNGPIELYVMEQRFYQAAKKKNQPIDRSSPLVINTPTTMPPDYENFPKLQPRTCTLRLTGAEATFGFEVVNGEFDTGAYIQEVFPDTPASRAGLRKSDRIIQIDDKTVDKDLSKSILDKLGKAKTKGMVKLQVMDTETYRQKQDRKASVSSKSKRRSQSEDQLSTANGPYSTEQPYSAGKGNRQEPPSATSSIRTAPKGRTPSVPDLRNSIHEPVMTNGSALPPTKPIPAMTDNIRLCTINRADPDDTFGIELNYHRRDQYHSLSIIPGRYNGPSNAFQAGIRTDDRLIEINDKNIQNLDHDQVTNLIRSVVHPQPLKVLVADKATYEYYQSQEKLITRNLPSVRVLPPNGVERTESPSRSSRQSIDVPATSRTQLPPTKLQTFNRKPDSPGSGINDRTTLNSLESNVSANSLQPRQVPITKNSNLSNGVGFNFRTTANDLSTSATPFSHIINSVDNPNALGTQGLRVGDYIISINDENVEYLNHDQLEEKLRRAPNSETVRLLVADGSVYRAYKQSSKPAPLPTSTGFRPNEESPRSNLRRCRLALNPNFDGYGFRVRSNYQTDGSPHQIISVEPNSPADMQGLRVGDFILRVNDRTVEHMNSIDFNNLMQNLIRNGQHGDGILFLEVMDEPTYLRKQLGNSAYVAYEPTSDSSPVLDTDESYPKIRHCFVRSWPNYQDLGFSIAQSPGGGYQIQQLRLDSPAAHTQIRNGDHLIQVNNINVEATDYQYVQQLLNESYRRDGTVSLLVIDDYGYQWYKRNHFRIDPLSQRANVVRHVTPEHQAVYTSTDSFVPSPFGEQMLGQREIDMPSMPYQPASTLNSRPPSTGPPFSARPYTSGSTQIGGIREPYRSNFAPSVTSSLSRTRTSLSRAAVDVVDSKSMSRVCRLTTEPGQPFGFELAQEDNKHVIRNVKSDSPAARAGLHNDDRLMFVNDDDVTHQAHRDVVAMIKKYGMSGVLRLTILPNTVKPIDKVSVGNKTKSLPSLNDDRIFQTGMNGENYNGWSPYEAPIGGAGTGNAPLVKYMSTSRLDNTGLASYPYTERPYSALGSESHRQYPQRPTLLTSQPYLPTDPWPRKCVLIRDPAFQGCGFRMIEKDNYDTPIVVEVRANSPAKRSGLTEGDHIIYIDNRNIQAIRTFDEMTMLIQRTFEETGQVTLVTLTAPAYQVLKRKGGYLQPEPFDYQLPFVRELSPRLCQILLHNHESDFGFTLQRGNPIHIKDVHPGSPAYEYGLRMNDKILEINGRDTVSLSSDQIIDVIESSKRRRQLNLLVIDTAGYEFSIKHAIPLNSLLPFVQIGQRRAMSSRRNQQEPVYL